MTERPEKEGKEEIEKKRADWEGDGTPNVSQGMGAALPAAGPGPTGGWAGPKYT